MSSPIPDNEPGRLAALASYNVAGTPPEMDFDEIAEMATHICGCPVAVVNVVAEKWEWYKGKCGIPEHAIREPRGGICSTTICSNDLLIVPDLSKDERFADHDIVKGRPYYRFYAGAPLINPDGFALGSLCVLDYEPREIAAEQKEMLRWLTRQAVAQLELRRKVAALEETRLALDDEKRKADELLRNILPEDIAEELKAHGKVQPRYHDPVTILFTDFKGFTRLSERLEPRTLIEELNDHFSAFDDIVARHGLEKLKTIGDAYMCASGLPKKSQTHAIDACAGVVGKSKFEYDIWGDAVNVAALMEANAEPGQIILSDNTLGHVGDRFDTEFRDEIDSVKKGRIRCNVLKGSKSQDA